MREQGYYRILRDHDSSHDRDRGFVAGAIGYVVAAPEELRFFLGEYSWTYKLPDDLAEFDADLAFEPEGARLQAEAITALMAELDQESQRFDTAQRQLVHFEPFAAGGELAGTGSGEAAATSVRAVKTNLTQLRNSVLRTEKTLNAKRKELDRRLSQQMAATKAKMASFQKLAQRADEALWSINLYLGRNEEILTLREGAPAAVDAAIVIHQDVKFMDEECGLRGAEGGIDVRSVKEFDRWLLESPANLDRVLPDPRGLLVFHIKRYDDTDYDNPWLADAMHQANLRDTYLLARNGEQLYRVLVDIEVGMRLFPDPDEYQSFFATEEDDPDHPGERRQTFLKPGSEAYMQALKSAQARQRHHLRIVLLLQGILDRTKLFAPLAVQRVNLCDPASYGDVVTLKHTPRFVLTDGRPTFHEWQRTINSQLAIGMRIIGAFNARASLRASRHEYRESRIRPPGASSPPDGVLLTLEERDGDRFTFRYDRTDWVYRRDRPSGPAETRASCWVTPEDRFLLNIDAATEEELVYYQGHRQSRHDYRDMLPVLEAALAAKRREAAEEEPFRKLLIAQIAQAHDVPLAAAAEDVDALVTWWKFKNRTHRAIAKDDWTALKMIVQEYGLRRQQQQVRAAYQATFPAVVAAVTAATGGVVAIFHKRDNVFVAYQAANEQAVWVHEEEWTVRRDGRVERTDRREWRLVDKRHQRWEAIHTTPRWTGWAILPSRKHVLTDPELEALCAAIVARPQYVHLKTPLSRKLPLAFYHDDDFEVTFWFAGEPPAIPDLLVSEPIQGVRVFRQTVRWERHGDAVTLAQYQSDHHEYLMNAADPPWRSGVEREQVSSGLTVTRTRTMDGERLIREWPENLALVAAEQDQVRDAERRERQLGEQYAYVDVILQERSRREIEAELRREFDEEYGDLDLWPDFLAKQKVQPNHYRANRLLKLYAERGIDPVGRTFQEVLDQARDWGCFEDRSWHRDWGYDDYRKHLPLAERVPPPAAGTEDDDDA